MTYTIFNSDGIFSCVFNSSLLTLPKKHPPNPASVAARSIVCPTIPASTSSLTFAGQVITIYPVGFSPSDGPSQSFKYPANPNSLKTFSFSSSSHTILYLNGCLLAADGVSLAVSTSSISCCLVSFFS